MHEPKSEEYKTASTPKEVEPDRRQVTDKESVPGTAVSKVWSKYIPRINNVYMIISLLCVFGISWYVIDYGVEHSRLMGSNGWYIILYMFAAFVLFYLYENIVLSKRFAHIEALVVDYGMLVVIIVRNLLLILNFIPGIQLFGILGFQNFGIIFLLYGILLGLRFWKTRKPDDLPKSEEYQTASTPKEVEPDRGHVTDGEGVSGTAVSKVWSKYIPRINNVCMIISILCVFGLSWYLANNSGVYSGVYSSIYMDIQHIMLSVFVVFVLFYLFENIILSKKFANTEASAVDDGMLIVIILRNVIFISNFIPGIQMLTLFSLLSVGSVIILLLYIVLLGQYKRAQETRKPGNLPKSEEYQTASTLKEVEPDRGQVTDGEGVSGTAVSKVWSKYIPRTNNVCMIISLLCLFGISYSDASQRDSFWHGWLMLSVFAVSAFAVFVAFYLYENIVFSKKFANIEASVVDDCMLIVIIVRNLIFILNFMYFMPLFGLLGILFLSYGVIILPLYGIFYAVRARDVCNPGDLPL